MFSVDKGKGVVSFDVVGSDVGCVERFSILENVTLSCLDMDCIMGKSSFFVSCCALAPCCD